MAANNKLSPMMQQYMEIKQNYKDCILFFRLGDFYEMFFEDATLVSRELELTLTGKNCGLEERAPMCGVPFHSSDTYIARLIEKGYKVAVCEQTEDPAAAKGIVKREVVQIVTPGTVMSNTMLRENENNYIASVYGDGTTVGLCYCDVSTGEISLTSIQDDYNYESLINELVKINVKEVLINEDMDEAGDSDRIRSITGGYFNVLNRDYFNRQEIRDIIMRQFAVSALMGLGIEENTPSMYAAGSLLIYLRETQKNNLSHIIRLNTYSVGQHMSLDKATIKNLELTETIFEKKLNGSLLWVLDKTNTAMGSRKLKQWIKEPLNDVSSINERLDSVEFLMDNVIIRNDIRENLKLVYDFERLAGRIACGNANAKDMLSLKQSCRILPEIKSLLSEADHVKMLKELDKSIHELSEIYQLIEDGIEEDAPFTLKEGGIIKRGYSAELDNLKDSISDAQSWIASLEGTERERTGIKNLKVGYNKVFGYYLEVTKSYYDLIPDNYIRKQTLSNCERFITPELKETERTVLNAESRINQMEYDLFVEIRQRLKVYIDEIQDTSKSIAVLDVLNSFATVSERNNYTKPNINEGDVILIEKGRHPVIEQTIKDGLFVSNDTFIDKDSRSLLLITGPNMAGKSTYMRQTALIVLMAQIGCFVPCNSSKIGVCDRIFTRIGASDNLSQGQSTFFVEMSELSYILNTATERSLIVLDEIGRGTSTYDGLSIAWATAEHLCRKNEKIRGLFATHYHEMTALEGQLPGLKNLNVDVLEENGNVVFLHKIVEGSASRSYGIHVAKLAGAPDRLLNRAETILSQLENDGKSIHENVLTSDVYDIDVSKDNDKCLEEEQLSFFKNEFSPVADKLRSIDLMETTPSQAIKILEELKGLI